MENSQAIDIQTITEASGEPTTMWSDLIKTLPGPTHCQPPASQTALLDCATALGHPLPEGLADLLRETNGIEDADGTDVLWSAERIAAENSGLRGDANLAELYMPFDPLVFFGDAGNGDLFALLARVRRPDVYLWDHENDSRTWIASSLAAYVELSLTGQIGT